MQAHTAGPQPEQGAGQTRPAEPPEQPEHADQPGHDQPGRDQHGRDDWSGRDDQYAEADLERLAAEMTARGYQATLRQPAGRLPHLDVRNPRASVMSEQVYAQADWFFWSWAQRIAPCGQPAAAAAIIARVLRADGEPVST